MNTKNTFDSELGKLGELGCKLPIYFAITSVVADKFSPQDKNTRINTESG